MQQVEVRNDVDGLECLISVLLAELMCLRRDRQTTLSLSQFDTSMNLRRKQRLTNYTA